MLVEDLGIKYNVLKVCNDSVSFITELRSNQEEADTRLILHAKYMSLQGSNNVIVVRPDTDVLVLLLHHFDHLRLDQLFLKR